MASYKNGYVPATARSRVAGQPSYVTLDKKAAYWFGRARADAAKRGLTLNVALPAGGYRDYFTQVDMRKNPRKYNLNPNSAVKLAFPGYSTHGTGDRVDVVGTGANWFLANSKTYGFSREFGAKDPNHYKHNGKAIPATPSTPKPPPPIGKEDDDMAKAALIHYKGKSSSNKSINVYGLYVPGTPWFVRIATNDNNLINGIARSNDTGASVQVTEGVWNQFASAALALAPNDELAVTLKKPIPDEPSA